MMNTRGELLMKIQFGLIACCIVLVLAGGTGVAAAATNATQTGQAATIAPYNGPIGPGNSLYGLKLAFENIDESFTFNQSERLEKQISHADIRLAELKHELTVNNTNTVNIALEQYRLKMNQTEEALDPALLNGTAPSPATDNYGLEHAQEMITKHQAVLEELLQSHPDNKGLERAYNNSVSLAEKFEKRIERVQKNQQEVKQNRSFVPSGDRTLSDNETFMNPGHGRGTEDNKTVPMEWNQSRDMNQFAGNTTRNMEPNMHGINQSVQDLR
jgi:TolA-binding protein